MRIEIIRGDELKRVVWEFSVRIDCSSPCIYFDRYTEQHKDSPRQRIWRTDDYWDRLNRRESRIKEPPIPDDVKVELITRIKELVDTLPIKD